MKPRELVGQFPHTILAFRGYNVANLGRTPELLQHPAYSPIVIAALTEASKIAGEILGRQVDLVNHVREKKKTDLDSYADDVTMIVAVELAQLRLLQECFQIDYRSAKLSMGYSLGEISALIAGGVVTMEHALVPPLKLAADCVDLAAEVSMGVLFSREGSVALDEVEQLCQEINCAGNGVIGISALLSPNSLLLLGQQNTVECFKKRMKEQLSCPVYLRKNDSHWPPLHSPIVWQRSIPNRSAEMLHTMPAEFKRPSPPILSLVSGDVGYTETNVRAMLHRWCDHPQRLWDGVYQSLAMGVKTIVHVGPQPNIIPATFKRLHDNVEAQTRGSIGMRALSVAISRPWLKALLPARTALMNAPNVQHVILEDWLLEQTV